MAEIRDKNLNKNGNKKDYVGGKRGYGDSNNE